MAYQRIPGNGMYFPAIPGALLLAPAFSNTLIIDLTGEMAAFVGRVFFPATGTKDISRVGFRFGSPLTKTGLSALTVSLQDVILTAGTPGQPDGVQDQTVAIANGNASFAANAWIRTGTFSSNRTVSNNDLLAVVIEYDGAGRLVSDSVIIAGIAGINSQLTRQQSFTLLKTGGVWAAGSQVLPNVVLEMSDGTFGGLCGCMAATAATTHAFASNTAVADEYGLAFSLPFPCKIDGAWFMNLANVAGSDFEVCLYVNSSTTATATVSTDGNTVYTSNTARYHEVGLPETLLAANQTHIISVRPTTTNTISAWSFDVADANHFQSMDGGPPFRFVTRVDQGAWAAPTATRRLFAGVRISSFPDGTAAARALII